MDRLCFIYIAESITVVVGPCVCVYVHMHKVHKYSNVSM